MISRPLYRVLLSKWRCVKCSSSPSMSRSNSSSLKQWCTCSQVWCNQIKWWWISSICNRCRRQWWAKIKLCWCSNSNGSSNSSSNKRSVSRLKLELSNPRSRLPFRWPQRLTQTFSVTYRTASMSATQLAHGTTTVSAERSSEAVESVTVSPTPT